MKGAVIPGPGINDGFLMMIVSHHLTLLGYDVTIFHEKLEGFKPWMKHYQLKKLSSLDELNSFDEVILQNDNSARIKEIIAMRNQGSLKKLSVFYFSYKQPKNSPLHENDVVFDKNKTIVDNLAIICSQKFNTIPIKETGLEIPANLIHKKYQKRVVIHPNSGTGKKNWSESKFIAVAKRLQYLGLQTALAVTLKDRDHFLYVEKLGIELPILQDLTEMSAFIYESGFLIGNDSLAGHIASYFNIPSIILASNPKNMSQWQPGWLKAKLIYPPSWVPNVSGFRLREKKWRHFIIVSKVLQVFFDLSKDD